MTGTRGRRTTARWGRLAAAVLVAAGGALVAAWGWEVTETSRETADADRRAQALLRPDAPATPTATVVATVLPTRTPPPPPTATPIPMAGEALGRLSIPRLELTVSVLEGVDDTVLEGGAGRFPETAPLGGAGNTALAAHRDTHFRALRHVRTGDVIEVEVPGRTVRYEVSSTSVVGPQAVEVLDDAGDDRLTLVTCHPFDWVGPAPRRFVVVALRLPDTPTGGNPRVVDGAVTGAETGLSADQRSRTAGTGSRR